EIVTATADDAAHDVGACVRARPSGTVSRVRTLDRSLMAQRKPPRRTRERILETALALFNRFGEPHVTTGHIADELNISPGNLYYHFRNKDDIIGDLYAALEAKIAPLTAIPPDRAPHVDDLWLLLHLLFERMREYRFF